MPQITTHFATKGLASAATARNLIVLSGPAQHILDQTVEIYSKHNVIVKVGRYGETIYVRFNAASPTRYFPVLRTEDGYKCTCGKVACQHIKQAVIHLKSQEVA